MGERRECVTRVTTTHPAGLIDKFIKLSEINLIDLLKPSLMNKINVIKVLQKESKSDTQQQYGRSRISCNTREILCRNMVDKILTEESYDTASNDNGNVFINKETNNDQDVKDHITALRGTERDRRRNSVEKEDDSKIMNETITVDKSSSSIDPKRCTDPNFIPVEFHMKTNDDKRGFDFERTCHSIDDKKRLGKELTQLVNLDSNPRPTTDELNDDCCSDSRFKVQGHTGCEVPSHTKCRFRSLPDMEPTGGKENSITMLGNYTNFPNFVPENLRSTVIYMLPEQQNFQVESTSFVNEFERLATFKDVILPPRVFAIRLAQSGFFLPNPHSEHIICTYCAIQIQVTTFIGQQADEVHRQLSPQCSYILGQPVEYVSIAQIGQRSGSAFLDSLPSGPDNRYVLALTRQSENITASLSSDKMSPGNSNSSRLTDDGIHREPVVDSVQHANVQTNGLKESSSLPNLNNSTAHAKQSENMAASLWTEKSSGNSNNSYMITPEGIHRTHTVYHVQNGSSSVSNSIWNGGSAAAPFSPNSAQDRPEDSSRSSTNNHTNLTPTINQGSLSGSNNNSLATDDPTSEQTIPLYPASETQSIPTQTARPVTTTNTSDSGQDSRTASESRSTKPQKVTYEQLGIYAQRPKRPDMAMCSIRIRTFANWPHKDTHPPEMMAEAGFYFTDHVDLVRCFFCKGGLKSWDRTDIPWVEHGRWFPNCAFVKICKGLKFVEVIRAMGDTLQNAPMTEEVISREVARLENEERKNGTLSTVDSFSSSSLDELTRKSEGIIVEISEGEKEMGAVGGVDVSATSGSMEIVHDLEKKLKEKNNDLKNESLCKVCQSSEVNVLFLPCGHLIACAQCSLALRSCAVCRQSVKGIVRVLMDI